MNGLTLYVASLSSNSINPLVLLALHSFLNSGWVKIALEQELAPDTSTCIRSVHRIFTLMEFERIKILFLLAT